MNALSEYIQARGLKFGLYTDVGGLTCGGYPGSRGYESVDVTTFAAWGVSYLKVDGCLQQPADYKELYLKFGQALKGTDIVYSCSMPAYLGDDEAVKPFDWMYATAGCNLWRNWHDISNTWESLASIIQHWARNTATLEAAPQGAFNDPDMLLVGDDHGGVVLSAAQARVQMAVWALVSAPLFIGGDPRSISATYRDILTNAGVLAIHADSSSRGGCRQGCNGTSSSSVWARSLAGGDLAVLFVNLGQDPVDLAFTVLLPPGTRRLVACLDVWEHRQPSAGENGAGFESTAAPAIVRVGLHAVEVAMARVPATSQRFLRLQFASDDLERTPRAVLGDQVL